MRNSSICVTFLLLVRRVEGQGATEVAEMSREVNGPESSSSSRMSSRKLSLAWSHE